MTEQESQVPTREWHGKHLKWGYSENSFIWIDGKPDSVNFFPIAEMMRAWLLRNGKLSLITAKVRAEPGSYTNPYTYSGVALCFALAQVVDDYFDLSNATAADGDDPVEAEIQRLRVYNEVLLYIARICEATIKQMLYCTQFPPRHYKAAALGGLLECRCKTCKKENGREPHSISLLGSLAHPFKLCWEIDRCVLDHIAIVNRLRNEQAAHSGMQELDVRTVAESRDQMRKDCDKAMEDFIHMLSHLEKIERAMFDDLTMKGNSLLAVKQYGLTPNSTKFLLEPGMGRGIQWKCEMPPTTPSM